MKIAVVGYGVEGRALVDYFLKKGGVEITICDQQKKEVAPAVASKVKTRFGPHYLDDLKNFDLIFRSPGIPYLTKQFHSVRKKLTSLTDYFFEKCPCPIVGVTGTKGKGTTATLIFEMLKTAGRSVFLGGNIGETPLGILDELTRDDVVILELSSFQLQDLRKSPHVAVVLGITSDHLDHHADMEEYVEAKKNIVRFQTKTDCAIIDVDNKHSANFASDTQANILPVSIENTLECGAFLKVGSLVLIPKKTDRKAVILGEKSNVKLLGQHNVKNVLAAAAAAHSLGVPVEIVSKVIREFNGLPHRLEFVKEINEVKFYNDSLSTNPHTTIAALKSFTAPLILIAGGSDKNLDFTPLGEEIAKRLNVKTVILMGETKAKIEHAVEQAVAAEDKRINARAARISRPILRRDIPLELITAESYQEAFMVARLLGKPGDVVLLSPGAASFDMFKDYKERGEVFRSFILDL